MSEGEGLNIAIIGATGAVGGDLLAALPKSALPLRELRLFASPASVGRVVEHGDRVHRVQALGEDIGSTTMLEGVDLAFLALPSEAARFVGPILAERGIMVVDIGGSLADRGPLVVPAVGADSLQEAARERVVCSPSAPGVLLATVLGALREFAPVGAQGTVLLSAGAAGRAGVDELSGQVVAMFNQKEPPRRVFPNGLAFDLLPGPGAVRPPDDPLAGWTDAEVRLASEVAAVVDLPAPRLAFSLMTAPFFSGLVASLQIELEHEANMDELRAALGSARGLNLADPVPGPRRVVGRSALFVGRLRNDPSGSGGLHLLAVGDNLRFGASNNAIAIATALWEGGLL